MGVCSIRLLLRGTGNQKGGLETKTRAAIGKEDEGCVEERGKKGGSGHRN